MTELDSKQKVLKLKCPSCRTEVLWTDEFPHRPFCSQRCKLTDFGEWAKENHRISGDKDDDKLSEEPFDDY